MGYTTEFEGVVTINPPLSGLEVEYLQEFSETRRMHRENGPLFVKGTGYAGQGHDEDILAYNDSDPDQPGLWCQWVPTPDGTALVWNGAEKFYAAQEWMKYLVTNLLAPSARAYLEGHRSEDWRLEHFTTDHRVDGVIRAQGEEDDDVWEIVVEDSVVMVAGTVQHAPGEFTFLAPQPV